MCERYCTLSQYTDRNGTVHVYRYDLLGRPTEDEVITFVPGVDNLIVKLGTGYDTAGRAARFTSYSYGGTYLVENEVLRVYNGLGQLATEYQEHAGAVDPDASPKVRYVYSEMAGGANHSRLLTTVYPNGRAVQVGYAGALDNAISRANALIDGVSLESLSYVGLGTAVKRARAEPGVELTYLMQPGDPPPPAAADPGDPYKGLDRFGRARDQHWLKTATATSLDRFQ